MLALKNKYNINQDDLVICLISGGGSALMPSPVDVIELNDKQNITQQLLESGANIGEINTVRKHLSKIKGGRLGQFFAPAKVVSLVISDVAGNSLNVIASGPTMRDPTTFKNARNVFKRYNLKLPQKVKDFIERGCAGMEKETPKKLFNCDNFVIGDSKVALRAAAIQARKLGLKAKIVTAELVGDPKAVAKKFAQEIVAGKFNGYNTLLFSGETTPRVPAGHGLGGRNQFYVAASMVAMQAYHKKWAIASVSTDGSDYLQEIAGAIVDYNSFQQAIDKKINIESYIKKYDTYTFFKKLSNSLIIIGDTGTNVGDVIVYVLK